MSRDWEGVKGAKSNQIYIGNLPDGITEKMLVEQFSQVRGRGGGAIRFAPKLRHNSSTHDFARA